MCLRKLKKNYILQLLLFCIVKNHSDSKEVYIRLHNTIHSDVKESEAYKPVKSTNLKN